MAGIKKYAGKILIFGVARGISVMVVQGSFRSLVKITLRQSD